MAKSGILNMFFRPSSMMLLAGAAVLGFLAVRNYSTPGTPPAEKAIAQDVKKRKHGKVKKGARDPIKTPGGAWVYGNVANDDILAGEGYIAREAMNSRSMGWHYGQSGFQFDQYPVETVGILEGVIPYVGMDLTGGPDDLSDVNEIVRKKSPKAMYARMIKGGY